MSTTEESLNQLEKDIRQLKIEYEQYFGGGRARPPVDTEWRIESTVKRFGDRGANMNFAQRFRFTNLAQTHAKYREFFRKRLKQREEGTVPRAYGAAAKQIQAERARKRAQEEREEFAQAKKGKAGEQVPAGSRELSIAISCSDFDRENDKVGQLFDTLRNAKEQAGEKSDALTLEAFREFVKQKTQQLKDQKGAQEVEYFVVVDANHARLKARVKS